MLRHLVAVTATAMTVLTGCAVTTAGNAVPADNRGPTLIPLITTAQLSGLLLQAQQVATIVGFSPMKLADEYQVMSSDADKLSDSRCAAAWAPAQKSAYADASWTSIWGNLLTDTGDGRPHERSVAQAVVLFSTAELTRQFFTHAQDDWQKCANGSVKYTDSSAQQDVWFYGAVNGDDSKLTMSQTMQGGTWACQRALTTRNNVVIDTMACGVTIADEADTIASLIADGVTHA